MEEVDQHGEAYKSSGRGSRINICFSLPCLFIGFSPLHMLAGISRRMFSLYKVPCPGAMSCYALKQKLPLATQTSLKKTHFLLTGAEPVFIMPVGHSKLNGVGQGVS